jgi:hypothetical protein
MSVLRKVLLPLVVGGLLSSVTTGFSPAFHRGALFSFSQQHEPSHSRLFVAQSDTIDTGPPDLPSTAPVLNGKRVLPLKVTMSLHIMQKGDGRVYLFHVSHKLFHFCLYYVVGNRRRFEWTQGSWRVRDSKQ